MKKSTVFAIFASVLLALCIFVSFAAFDLDGNAGTGLGTRVNVQPSVTAHSVNPTSIVDNADASVTFTCTATDSDGTVDNVTVTSSLWTGSWYLTKGAGDDWSGTFTILKANLTSLGAKTVTFTAEDNASGTGTNTTDLTVTLGNTVPTSNYSLPTPFPVIVDEDSDNYITNLVDLIEDDDIGNVSFQIGETGSFGTSFTHDNFSVALENDTWINISFTADAFNAPIPFTVNATDPNFSLEFNVSVEIEAVNDAPVWDELQLIEPSGTAVDIVDGENITLEVDEDSEYNFTLVATDVEMDALTYDTNATIAFLEVEDNGNISFAPLQVHVGNLTVWFTATDGTDTIETIVNFTVLNVNDQPGRPTVDFEIFDSHEKTPDVAENLTVVFTVTRPNDEDRDTNFTYTFTFDDGTTETYGPTEAESFTYEYTYAGPGKYNVTVSASDGQASNTSEVFEVEVIEPPSGPEWHSLGFKIGDIKDEFDDTVLVDWTELTITSTIEDLGDGNSKATTVYHFSGTCSDNVVVVHIYFGSQLNDDAFTYMPFYNLEDFTMLEIEADGGVWDWDYTYEMTYPTPDPVSDDDDIEPNDDVYHAWYAAIAWTEDNTHNIAEKEFEAGGGGTGDDDDDDDDTSFFAAGIICFIIPVVAFLFVVILIIIIIVVVVKKKGKKKEEESAAPAEPPVTCFCGTAIPEGMEACPSCGAAKPAPQAEGAQDLYGGGAAPPPPPADGSAPPPPADQGAPPPPPVDPAAADMFAPDPNAAPLPENDPAANAPPPAFGHSMEIEELPEESKVPEEQPPV